MSVFNIVVPFGYILLLFVTNVVCYVQAIENLDTLVQLDSLYLGKNKITKIQNLSSLTNLTILSLQVLDVRF